MSGLEQQHIPWEGLETTLPSQETSDKALNSAMNDKHAKLAEVTNPELQKLAQQELDELNAVEQEKSGDETSILEARSEFESDIKALKNIEKKFGNLDNYDEFVVFLTWNTLSPDELEAFYTALADRRILRRITQDFEKSGLPLTKEVYVLFADKFWLYTSTELEEKNDEGAKNAYLKNLPELKGLTDVKEVAPFVAMLEKLETLEWDEAKEQMSAILDYLLWKDRKGWELDNILAALKKQDELNIANGNPTKLYETFARNVRDFSPDVARRIDDFERTYEASEAVEGGEPVSPYQRAVIEGGLPADGNIEMGDNGEFVSQLPDGTEVTIEIDGDHITRSINLEGANIPVRTDIERADYADALWDFEAVNQEFSPKKARLEGALKFLENPLYEETPLEDMKDALKKILWYTLYSELGVANAHDKTQLITTIQTNVGIYAQKLSDARQKYERELKQAVARNRERYRERDEKIKTTLKAIKNSSLGLLDVEYLMRNISAGLVIPEIGVTFDIQNIDIANQNFGEPLGETHNPTKHIEYIYRIANKVLTGNPDGMVDGKLVWYSLDQAILNPEVAQKNDAEMKQLLTSSWVWSENTGVNRATLTEKLSKPLDK